MVRELVDRGETVRGLPGRRVEATVLFCDLRGFTAVAEALPAERVLEMLNRYLTTMSEAILDKGGTVVSFQGDGLMAVFGTPVESPDHAREAFAAARRCSDRASPPTTPGWPSASWSRSRWAWA